MPRPHRSHSQLNSYLHCGHQYYLTKVRRVAESPSVWLPGGKAFHSTTEEFDLSYAWQDKNLDETRFLDLFTANFNAELDLLRANDPDESTWRTAGRATKEKPNKEDIAWWHVAGREMVAGYIAWRVSTADIWDIATVNGAPGIEVEVTMPLGGVPMKGWVDRVLRSRRDGRLLVADLKTGSSTPKSPLQLAVYSVQLEPLLGGEQVLWGAFYDARKGTLLEPINLAAWNEPRLGKVYGDLDRGITAGVFLPRIDSHCISCGVRDACIYQGGKEPATA